MWNRKSIPSIPDLSWAFWKSSAHRALHPSYNLHSTHWLKPPQLIPRSAQPLSCIWVLNFSTTSPRSVCLLYVLSLGLLCLAVECRKETMAHEIRGRLFLSLSKRAIPLTSKKVPIKFASACYKYQQKSKGSVHPIEYIFGGQHDISLCVWCPLQAWLTAVHYLLYPF